MKKRSWQEIGLIGTGALLLAAGVVWAGCDIRKAPETAKDQTQQESFWQTDFAAAQKESRASGKPILLSFSGSDWCGWCIKLDKEVFSKPVFQEWARANVIPVLLDFPRRHNLDPAVAQQNEALSEKYDITGFPTVLLVDADGNVLAETGYQEGGAENYVAHLEKLLGK